MNTKRIIPFAFAALVAAGAAAGVAVAADRNDAGDRRDLAALATLRTTLPQAIAAAEGQTGGRAVSADLEHGRDATRIAVEVAGPSGVRTVLVDGQTGQVVGTRAAGDDGDRD